MCQFTRFIRLAPLLEADSPDHLPCPSCSNYETESEEMKRTTGVDLSPMLWLAKLLLGSIDRSYDSKDEARR
jgi:hypothetical protein